MKDISIISKAIPASPRSKNYHVGTTFTGSGGGAIIKDSGGESNVDIIKEGDMRSFTDKNLLSALRSVAEFISRKNDSSVEAVIDYLKGVKINGVSVTKIIKENTKLEDILDSDLMNALQVLREISKMIIRMLSYYKFWT